MSIPDREINKGAEQILKERAEKARDNAKKENDK